MTTLSDQEYWQRRFLQVKAKQLRGTEEYERALQPQLDGLFRDLHKEVSMWVDRYAKGQGIDSDQAREALAGIHTKHWRLTLDQFRAKAKAGGFESELDAEYFRSRVARLQSLEQQLKEQTKSFTQDQTDSMRHALANQYEDTYMRTNYNLQAAYGHFTADFARFNPAQLAIAVSQPWAKDGKDFSRRIWKTYQQELPSYLMDAVLRGTIMGWGPQKVGRMMHARFQDVKKSDVHRLVTSEMAHVAEEATVQAYEENQIEQYEYMATLESHTCGVCARLDGETFKMTERKPGVNYPIIHPYCRCTTVPYLEGLPPIKERWARDPETGKGKLVANVRYKEWKAMVDGKQPMPVIEKRTQPAPQAKPKTTVVPIVPTVKDDHPDYSAYTTGNYDDNLAAAKAYYQGGAYDVNSALREGMPLTDDRLANDLNKLVNANQTKKPMTVYRKVNSGELQAQKSSYLADNPELQFPDLKVGDTFADKGFMSTSRSNDLDRFNPTSEAFEGDTELVIDLPKGRPAADSGQGAHGGLLVRRRDPSAGRQ